MEVLFRGRRYGHDTSNVVESQNGVLKLDRELPIVPLLDAIWHRVMEKRADRLCAATALLEAGREMTPFVEGVVSQGRRWAQGNRVQHSTLFEARVVQPNGQIQIVNLTAGTCSCSEFQSNGIPCGHAIATILSGGESLTPYLPVTLSPAT